MPEVSNKAVTPMTEFCFAAAEEALTMSGWKPSEEADRLNTGESEIFQSKNKQRQLSLFAYSNL